MPPPKPLLTVKSLRDTGPRKNTTKLGPKAFENMDWEVLDQTGHTVGYLSGEVTAKTVNRLIALQRLLVEVGAYHHLKARFDNGYLEVPVEMLKELERLLA